MFETNNSLAAMPESYWLLFDIYAPIYFLVRGRGERGLISNFYAFTDNAHFIGIIWSPKDHVSSVAVKNISIPLTEDNWK